MQTIIALIAVHYDPDLVTQTDVIRSIVNIDEKYRPDKGRAEVWGIRELTPVPIGWPPVH